MDIQSRNSDSPPHLNRSLQSRTNMSEEKIICEALICDANKLCQIQNDVAICVSISTTTTQRPLNQSTSTQPIPDYCNRKPTTKGVCSTSMVHLRWYYDRDINQCRLFVYNRCTIRDDNRFLTAAQCIQKCQH